MKRSAWLRFPSQPFESDWFTFIKPWFFFYFDNLYVEIRLNHCHCWFWTWWLYFVECDRKCWFSSDWFVKCDLKYHQMVQYSSWILYHLAFHNRQGSESQRTIWFILPAPWIEINTNKTVKTKSGWFLMSIHISRVHANHFGLLNTNAKHCI